MKSKSTRNHIACNNALPVLEGVEYIIKHRVKEQKENAMEEGGRFEYKNGRSACRKIL